MSKQKQKGTYFKDTGARVLSYSSRRKSTWMVFWSVLLFAVGTLSATQRNWTTEEISQGVISAIAIDSKQNVHVAYVTHDAKLMYAFRPNASTRWFTVLILDSTHATVNVFPRIVADKQDQPHVCIAIGTLEYISFKNGSWRTQEIDPNSGVLSYHCAIGVSDDGTPHIIWYHEFLPGGKQFAHARHADLENGKWLVRSIDGGISGKWNSMVIDPQGLPHVTYSQWSAAGDLRYAQWDGKEWNIEALPAQAKSTVNRGYDNSLVLDNTGEPHVSYLDDKFLEYAYRQDGKWTIEKVIGIDANYDFYRGNTVLMLDSYGTPHIVYGDVGAIKHAYRKEGKWEVENVVSGAIGQYPNVDAVIGPDDTMYVCYTDPEDGRVKVATGSVTAGSGAKKK